MGIRVINFRKKPGVGSSMIYFLFFIFLQQRRQLHHVILRKDTPAQSLNLNIYPYWARMNHINILLYRRNYPQINRKPFNQTEMK